MADVEAVPLAMHSKSSHVDTQDHDGKQYVLFAWSFRFDCLKTVELSQIDITVDIGLLLAIFVWNPPLLTLIVIIPPITILV